ncbi:MAG: hypothetical protein U0168_15700 [Nannocystaceae bacterium]
MADPAEFSPQELDHIEDSLEALEFAPTLHDAAPPVRRRLDDYRQILSLSRSALPMVEVPRGLLDGVLAEARAAAEVHAVTPTVVAAPERPSLWTRLRKLALIPGLALAGTAALVLVMVQRGPEKAADRPAATEVAAAKADQSQAADRGPAGAPRGGEDAPAPAQPVTQQVPTAAPPPALPGSAASATPVAEPEARQEFAKGAAAPAEEENLEDAQTDELARKKESKLRESDKTVEKPADGDPPRWDIIARGDRARQRGDCSTARSEYSLALSDADARVQARAHAGLGLCDAMAGDRKAADAAYKVARDLDGEIVAFIDAERPRAPAAKAKPKAKNASKLDTDNAFEQ